MAGSMEKRKLTELIIEHKEKALAGEAYIMRDMLSHAGGILGKKEIHIITGVRRCGKSTLLRLLMGKLIDEGVSRNNILYLNFEDDRFAQFTPEDYQSLYEAFLEVESPKLCNRRVSGSCQNRRHITPAGILSRYNLPGCHNTIRHQKCSGDKRAGPLPGIQPVMPGQLQKAASRHISQQYDHRQKLRRPL